MSVTKPNIKSYMLLTADFHIMEELAAMSSMKGRDYHEDCFFHRGKSMFGQVRTEMGQVARLVV